MSPEGSDNDKLNPGEADYRRKFEGLRQAETDGTASGSKDSGSGSGGVKDAEENPDKPKGPEWLDKTTSDDKGPSKSKGKLSGWKRKGPIAGIVVGLFAAGVSLIGMPAMITQTILANVVGKFNTGETSMTLRSNKVIKSRMLVESTTTGYCKVVKAFCRFSRPSNRFLKQLEKNGIQAIDGAGKAIKQSPGLWPNDRPKAYRFTNEAGDSIDIKAKDLYSKLLNDSEFRSAFHKSTMTRFVSLTDSVFTSIKARFGIAIGNLLKKVTGKDITSEIDNNVKVDDSGAKAAASEGEAAIEEVVKKEFTAVGTEAIDKTVKAGKGDMVGLVADGVCTLTDIPGMITKASRAIQMAQLVKYSIVFLSAFGAIKAGDASPAEASAVGDILTKTDKNGKSAMDSFGMNYAINGSTKPTNSNYTKFAPGGSIIKTLSPITKITNSKVKKGGCDVMTNPVTGEAINVALAANSGETLGASLLLAGVNIVGGYALSELAGIMLPPILKFMVENIPADFMKSINQYFFGDLTQNLAGENVGDALVSGAGHIMGQTANAGGNVPLSVPDAVAYDETTKQVQLAYAEEDRATKSPLDISSPNTMMGSIVQKLLPFYVNSSSSVGSVANTFSMIGNIVMSSFGMALNPTAAKAAPADGSQYQLCDDPDIKDSDIAAGPYCNIIYGIPNQYLGKEPIDVVKDLVASGDLDPNSETGEPVDKTANNPLDTSMSLKSWMEMCTDGKTDQARNCMVTDEKTADYALYTVDSRVVDGMDNDIDMGGTGGESSAATGDPAADAARPDNVQSQGKGWTLKDNVDYSGVKCAAGTTEDGTYKHPKRGFTIRKCKTALGVISSLMSLKVVDMVAAAKKDGVTLTGSSWRSYETQQATYASNCHSGSCNPPTAKPGNSQHERGLAVDFENIGRHGSGPQWNWLGKNGSRFGFYNLPSEGWHWSMSGH